MLAAKKVGKPAKVDVCHTEGNGSFHLINVSSNALPAHIAHGDAQPGDGVPGDPTKEFDDVCGLVDAGPPPAFTTFLPGEASGQSVTLSCEEGTISVTEAVYGGNCVGGGFSPDTRYPLDVDETAHLADACDGEQTCAYTVNHTVIGDLYFGCPKTYEATWTCE